MPLGSLHPATPSCLCSAALAFWQHGWSRLDAKACSMKMSAYNIKRPQGEQHFLLIETKHCFCACAQQQQRHDPTCKLDAEAGDTVQRWLQTNCRRRSVLSACMHTCLTTVCAELLWPSFRIAAGWGIGSQHGGVSV